MKLARLWGVVGGLLSGLTPFAFLDALGLPWILATVAIAVYTAARDRGERLGAREGARLGAHLASVAAPVTFVCLALTWAYVELRLEHRGVVGPLANVRSTPREAIRDAFDIGLVWAVAVAIVAPAAGMIFGVVLGPRSKRRVKEDAA